MSSRATFVTLSKALCSNGIMALFGISQLPVASELSPSTSDYAQREEMIERFKIPRTACEFSAPHPAGFFFGVGCRCCTSRAGKC